MTCLPTPTEELEIRQHAEKAWRSTWANCTDLAPKQAFIEGYYLAFWCGIMACRATRIKCERQSERLQMALSLSLLALAAAVAWWAMP